MLVDITTFLSADQATAITGLFLHYSLLETLIAQECTHCHGLDGFCEVLIELVGSPLSLFNVQFAIDFLLIADNICVYSGIRDNKLKFTFILF